MLNRWVFFSGRRPTARRSRSARSTTFLPPRWPLTARSPRYTPRKPEGPPPLIVQGPAIRHETINFIKFIILIRLQTQQVGVFSDKVNVTNTGSVDCDDVVLGFLTPPNAGKSGVPLQTLFGFERVFVKAGATVSVYLYPELTQFTQVQSDGTRVAAPGEYGVRFGLRESAELGMGFAEHSFTMA